MVASTIHYSFEFPLPRSSIARAHQPFLLPPSHTQDNLQLLHSSLLILCLQVMPLLHLLHQRSLGQVPSQYRRCVSVSFSLNKRVWDGVTLTVDLPPGMEGELSIKDGEERVNRHCLDPLSLTRGKYLLCHNLFKLI